MFKMKEYVKVQSLQQAYELNQKRSSRILGGMLWMKMSDAQFQTGIDLSGLGLDQIEETEDGFSIGCMVTLRQLELHEGLNDCCCNIVRESVKDIVGVQFRNLATVGGSIFGRFGFSDVLTCFLAMDTYVELYKGGIVPLSVFAEMERDRDVLVRLIVKKHSGSYAYQAHRNTKTDFPVLAVAAACDERGLRVSVGARPAKAICILAEEGRADKLRDAGFSEEEAAKLAEELAAQISTGSNMRASAEYRSHLARVLIKRALMSLAEKEGGQQ